MTDKADINWVIGRVGMLYRDLTPGEFKGKAIASHIRLPFEGEVPDYVHYHKVVFQVIYCLKGRIKVVYEDQGPPFWLETGDCVLQPPEIRHRVLECTAGAEVIEIASPVEHQTSVEREMALPTSSVRPDRTFSGQRFVRSLAAGANWRSLAGQVEVRETGILAASGGRVDVRMLRGRGLDEAMINKPYSFTYPLGDGETLVVEIAGSY